MSGGGALMVFESALHITGQMTIRSDHNIVTFELGRIYNCLSGSKLSETHYAGSHQSFTDVRVKEHPTSMYTELAVQIYLNPSYVTAAKEFSALWDDRCPHGHGASATTLSILPIDFMPDGTAITTPVNMGDVSGWTVAFTLSI